MNLFFSINTISAGTILFLWHYLQLEYNVLSALYLLRVAHFWALISLIISFIERADIGHLAVEGYLFPHAVASAQWRNNHRFVSTFLEKWETKGLVRWSQPSLRHTHLLKGKPGQSGRKPVNELTTSFASVLSHAVMHVRLLSPKTHRARDLYSIMTTCCSLLQ